MNAFYIYFYQKIIFFQDCPKDFHGNWTCMEGLHGGRDLGTFVRGNCSYEPQLYDSDWNSVLCVSNMRSSYLGEFYEEQTELNPILIPATTSPKGNYKQELDKLPKYPKIYKKGFPIRVTYNETQGIVGYLNMPYKSGTGCTWSPVAYLNDYTVKCSKLLTKSLCSKNTMLDYQMYLMPLPPGVNVGNIPKIIKNMTSDIKENVPIIATYYAAMEPELYVTSQTKVTTKNMINEIDTLTEILNEMKKEGENEMPIFHGIANEKCSKLEQFSKMDQYQEDQVHFDGDTTCINAVLEVNYDIYWNGTAIEKVHVNILLGNLSMIINNNAMEPKYDFIRSQSEFQHLHQIFSVKFKHNLWGYSYSSNSGNFVYLSGNPGYDIDKSLISALNISETNIALISSPKLWSISRTSSCKSTPFQDIKFLKDTQSGCLVNLSESNFSDCTQLQQSIRNIQKELVDIQSWIAKGGDLSNNITDYVKIIHEDFSLKKQFMTPKEENNKIIAMCEVPSHLHVEIMYSNTSNIYRISGVKVNYYPNKWTWICSKKSCPSKSYELKSSVQYIEVPVVWHYQNTSKFWILQSLNICDGDICWNEIMYPFTHAKQIYPFTIGDEIAFATMWGLALTPTALFIMWFLRYFW